MRDGYIYGASTAEEAHARFVIIHICHPLTFQITNALSHTVLKTNPVQTWLYMLLVSYAIILYLVEIK